MVFILRKLPAIRSVEKVIDFLGTLARSTFNLQESVNLSQLKKLGFCLLSSTNHTK